MAIPIELLMFLAAVGLIALCSGGLWAVPQLWYRIKYKRFKPSYQELELEHVREKQRLRVQHLNNDLQAQRERADGLATQLQETIDKLVSKL